MTASRRTSSVSASSSSLESAAFWEGSGRTDAMSSTFELGSVAFWFVRLRAT